MNAFANYPGERGDVPGWPVMVEAKHESFRRDCGVKV